MADMKTKYPSTSSVALSIALGSLANDSTGLVGKQSATVDNTTNLDIDHLVGGYVCTGTSPTAGGLIEVYVFASYQTTANVPLFPDSMQTTAGARTIQNAAIRDGAFKRIAAFPVASTSNIGYMIPPTSIAQLFGAMPKFWGVWVTNSTGVALYAGDANHVLCYERIQMQTV